MIIKKIYILLPLVFLKLVSFAQLNPLPIPPVLNGPTYNLTMQHGTRQFFPGITSATMGFNGNILGPTLILTAGQAVQMNVTNHIGEETTVHWHGLHVAPDDDGGPHTVIAPNTTWSPSFTVMDKAATYWYHPHLHDSTSKHVTLGLAGMIIVRDAEEAALNLPRTYGVDDIPVIIQTKEIKTNGVIEYFRAGNGGGSTDSTLLTNGVRRATINAPRQWVRLRLLNGSAQRVFNLGLSGGAFFYQIASDGGLLAQRAFINRLRLAPGERAEIVINFANYAVGANVQLVSYGGGLPNGTWGAEFPWSADIGVGMQPPGYAGNPLNDATFNILNFSIVATNANPIISIPTDLAVVTPIPESSSNRTRHKYFFAGEAGGVKIGSTNSAASSSAFSLGNIDDVVTLGSTEIWVLHGSKNMFHPFHIHDIQFYVLDRKDSLGNIIPLTPAETGRKDVIYVGPKETVRFITKFDDFFGATPYMYHCHITVHEDAGMMKQFIVTKDIYVDKNYVGTELGTFDKPFNTFREAVNAAGSGNNIYFKSSATHEELTSSLLTIKKLNVIVLNGPVIIQ